MYSFNRTNYCSLAVQSLSRRKGPLLTFGAYFLLLLLGVRLSVFRIVAKQYSQRTKQSVLFLAMFLSNGSVFRVSATRLKKKRKYRYRLFHDSMWHGGELTGSYALKKKKRERESAVDVHRGIRRSDAKPTQ